MMTMASSSQQMTWQGSRGPFIFC